MKAVRGQGFSVRFTRRGMAVQQPPPAVKTEESIPAPMGRTLGDDIFAEIAAMAQRARMERKNDMPAVTAKAAPDLERLLRMAAKAGDCGAIRRLVMQGADLDARDDGGRTALNIATQYNRTDAIKTLLAAREMRRMAALGELPETGFYKKFSKTAKNGSVR